jgi:hypothetical protein
MELPASVPWLVPRNLRPSRWRNQHTKQPLQPTDTCTVKGGQVSKVPILWEVKTLDSTAQEPLPPNDTCGVKGGAFSSNPFRMTSFGKL